MHAHAFLKRMYSFLTQKREFVIFLDFLIAKEYQVCICIQKKSIPAGLQEKGATAYVS